MAMAELSAEQKQLFEATTRFARSLAVDTRTGDTESVFPAAAWKACAAHGLLGLLMPTSLGGVAGGATEVALSFHALGLGCTDNGLAFSLLSQLTSVQIPLLHHASPAVKERYLRGLIDGSLIGAHAATEPDAGSDVGRLTTQARKVDGGYRVSGTKTMISLASVSHVAIVLARTPEGLAEFVVPRESYQVSRPFKKIGLRSSPIGELIFEDAFVPDDHLLGNPAGGMFRFLTTMEWERLLILSHTLGAMQRQLDLCVKYCNERVQSGQPIGKHQAVAHRVVDMKLRLETSRVLLYSACARKDATGRAGMESALVKLHLSEARVANALDAVKIFGGYGVLEEGEVERELRDAIPGLVYSGTAEILKNSIARLLGL